MDIEKKIRKLLALSESPNEFEAQAALLKARKLMAEYKLTEAELHEGNMIEKVYDDNTLSFKEKGLYTAIYLNETMNVDQLVESGKDKADAVRSGLKKLIEKQYIKKSVVREKNGNFVTVYYQVIE